MSAAGFPPPPPYGVPPPYGPPNSIGYATPPGQYAPIPVVPVDLNGAVAGDLPCRKCAYNLRGMPMGGRCPECGRAVGLSLMGDLLQYSDPAWVETLRRGINCILGGIIVMIVLAVYGAVTASSRRAGQVDMITAVLQILPQALFFLGGWFLTQPDPSGVGEDKYGTSRKVIRVALLVGVANPLLSVLMAAMRPSPELAMIILILSGLAGIMGLVGTFAQLQYLSKLAVRIPDPKLSARARFLMWAIGISYGALILVGIVAGLFVALATRAGARPGPPAGLAFIGCGAGIAGIALLIFGLMYLGMLEKFGKAFKTQAAYARQSWATVEGATGTV